MKSIAKHTLSSLLALSLVGPAMATYSKVVVFGDSLSDNGNLYALAGIPGVPYVNGRFSNGPVAVEVMSQTLGLTLQDFAYGGAETSLANYLSPSLYGTGVVGQIGMYSSASGGHADASALHVVWAGANDFFEGSNMLNPATAPASAQNLLADVSALYGLGAREFFVPLLPNLGLTASAYQTELSFPGFSAVAAQQSATYNGLLQAGFQNLTATLSGIHIQTFDIPSFMNQQIATYAAQGKDTTHACFDSSVPSLCANPDQYLFWDGVHPTAGAHQVLGQAFAAAVPEPDTSVLMLAGMLAIVACSGRGKLRPARIS